MAVRLSVEECCYWAMVAVDAGGIGFGNIARHVVSRDVRSLRKFALFNLKYARDDRAAGFDDWSRARLFAWRLCRCALAAIEAERSGRR